MYKAERYAFVYVWSERKIGRREVRERLDSERIEAGEKWLERKSVEQDSRESGERYERDEERREERENINIAKSKSRIVIIIRTIAMLAK